MRIRKGFLCCCLTGKHPFMRDAKTCTNKFNERHHPHHHPCVKLPVCLHPWGARTFLTCAGSSQVDCNLEFGRGLKKSQIGCIKSIHKGLKYTRNRLTYPIIFENSPKSRLEGRKTPQRCLECWGGLCSIMRDRYSWWTGLDWSLWATTRNKPEDALTCSASSDDISALSLLLLRSETLTHTPPIFTRRDRWRNTELVWWATSGARVSSSAIQVGLWKGEAVDILPCKRTRARMVTTRASTAWS